MSGIRYGAPCVSCGRMSGMCICGRPVNWQARAEAAEANIRMHTTNATNWADEARKWRETAEAAEARVRELERPATRVGHCQCDPDVDDYGDCDCCETMDMVHEASRWIWWSRSWCLAWAGIGWAHAFNELRRPARHRWTGDHDCIGWRAAKVMQDQRNALYLRARAWKRSAKRWRKLTAEVEAEWLRDVAYAESMGRIWEADARTEERERAAGMVEGAARLARRDTCVAEAATLDDLARRIREG
jgi:hypothetical protein